jgi:hypothetical protein
MGGHLAPQVCPLVIGLGLPRDELSITRIIFAVTTDGHGYKERGDMDLKYIWKRLRSHLKIADKAMHIFIEQDMT